MYKSLLVIPFTITTLLGHAQSWLPTVTTTAVVVTPNTITAGGNVTDQGEAAITSRGICWDTSPAPTALLATKTIVGTGLGAFTAPLNGLPVNTTYYVRAFANNAHGTAYGNEVSFGTLTAPSAGTQLPSVGMGNPPHSVTPNSAICSAAVSSEGSSPVTARGVCWSTSAAPTVSLATKTNVGSGYGNFLSTVTGLAPLSIYYVRPYATNAVGTAYGPQYQFSTNAGTIPVLTTTPASAVGDIGGCRTGGNITNGGSSAVSERGVCFGTLPNPTIGSPSRKMSFGTGTGLFEANIPNLHHAGPTYYFRAYAVNGSGTAYGNEVVITLPLTPLVSTVPMGAFSVTNRGVTANSGSNLTYQGYNYSTERGILWGTAPNPTLATALNKVSHPLPTEGQVSHQFAGTWSTTYFLRAYAVNSYGVAYGNEITFKTPAYLPVLSSAAVSAITGTSAVISAKVTDAGASAVMAQGVCYSTSPSPVYSASGTGTITVGNAAGPYTAPLQGLIPNTKYYVRAFAKNSSTAIVGSANVVYAYGTEASFTTVKK